MAIERSWAAVPAQPIITNGTSDVHISVPNSTVFFVKMKVTLFSDSVSPLPLEVKRINNINDMELGPAGDIKLRSNLTLILVTDSPMMSAIEQNRPAISVEDVLRASYANEPAVALRNLPVDQLGNAYNAQNPLPVSGGGLAPSGFDEVDILRDSDGDATEYQFLQNSIDIGNVDVTYDSDKNPIKYKKA